MAFESLPALRTKDWMYKSTEKHGTVKEKKKKKKKGKLLVSSLFTTNTPNIKST